MKRIVLILALSTSGICAEPVPELLGIIRSDTTHTLFGTQILPLGDQNNDNISDIMIWGGRSSFNLYYGGSPFDTLSALSIDSINTRMSNVGDINDDGFDDIAALGRTPSNWKLNVYYGGLIIDTLRDLWFGLDSLFPIGFSVNTQDINANGTTELFSWSNEQNSVMMFELNSNPDSLPDLILTPANFAYPSDYRSFGEGLISGDFNGDGRTDLAVHLRGDDGKQIEGSVYLYWGGPSFDTIPDMIISRPGNQVRGSMFFGRVLVKLGDVSGDGYDDFFAGPGVAFDDTINYVYFGGPNIDTIPDIVITERMTIAKAAGDLNTDGYNDLIISYPLPFGGNGYVSIYFGGPAMDSLPDIRIRNRDFDRFYDFFGMDCAGIGDFNGDGIDDFAFSAVNAANRGQVFIFSGLGPATDVPYEFEETLPDNYSLSNNYPNPFNPSTTIEFSLPRRAHTTLEIFNVLGAKVNTLLDNNLSAGSYKVIWDSHDSDGNEVASGVYFYKLETAEFVETKKMILVQ